MYLNNQKNYKDFVKVKKLLIDFNSHKLWEPISKVRRNQTHSCDGQQAVTARYEHHHERKVEVAFRHPRSERMRLHVVDGYHQLPMLPA